MAQTQSQEPIPVALYARDSSNSGDSVTTELEIMRQFCESAGFKPVIEYIDRNGNRDAFDRMMEDGTGLNPPFRRIVVLDFSRLSESMAERIECLKRLDVNRVPVISVKEGGGEHLPDSSLQNIKAIFNEYESHWQSEHTKRGLGNAASQGHYMSRLAPYGYRKVLVEEGGRQHFTLELDPQRSSIVQRIYETLLNESSERATAEELNHHQIPSPSGGQWTPTQVRRIRRNAVNCGTYIFGRKDTDPIRVPGAFPAIVTQEVFDCVNDAMEGRSGRAVKPAQA